MIVALRYAAFTALVLTASPVQAQPTWTLVPGESTLEFIVDIGGSTMTGSFSDWAATIRFDPDQPDQASLRVRVATTSVQVDDPRAQAIGSAPWLAVGDYPTAVFAAEGFDRASETGALTIDGNLTLRDVTRPLTLTGTLKVTGQRAEAQIAATILRLSHDIGVGQDAVGAKVQLRAHIVALVQN